MKGLLVGKVNIYTYITYYYPPWGGVAAQWSIKLIKYLDKVGWRSNVITVKDASVRYIDEDASIDLPRGIKVVRAPNFDLASKLLKQRVKKSESVVATKPTGVRKFFLRSIRTFYENFYLFEGQFVWIITSSILGLRSAKSSDIIFATIRPGAAGVIGAILKYVAHKPLVVDYRDPWTQNMTLPTGGFRKFVEEWAEKWVLESADFIVTVSEPVLDGLKIKYPKISIKGTVLPLGFDPEDFVHNVESDSKKINITYTGSLFSARSPEIFLKGLRMAIDNNPEIYDKLVVNFYGDFGGESHEKMVEDLKLSQVIKLHGFVNHRESVEKVLQADWLLLIIETISSEDKKDRFKGVYTGKLFEYLAARKPILALSPESAAADLIKKSRSGIVIPNDDPEKVFLEVGKIIEGRYASLIEGRDEALISNFSMEKHAKKLSDVFESVSNV